jgi:hypothetical protein
MGRPLKIAKAQAVLTITACASEGSVVTVSQNLYLLGIIAGMPFVTSSNLYTITAGVTYYVNEVLSAHTFSVSATQLSVQPQILVSLTDATGANVQATVGLIDNWFYNPNGSNTATNSSTYGVVGGNTALYGPQVLTNVCIGLNGTGTVFASTSSNVVLGLGTDFHNIPVGSHLYALWGGTDSHYLGTTNALGSNVLVGLANTTATTNVIGVDIGSNAQHLIQGGPVIFDVTAGNLIAGKTYFVHTIANAAAFTVSATPNGPNVALTTVPTVTGNAGQEQIVLTTNSANNASGVHGYGDPFVQALPEPGFIVRQKGKTKYLVQGTTTGLIGQCYTTNVANTQLTPNTMVIIATYSDNSTKYVQSVDDYQTRVFPNTIHADALSQGIVYTIYETGDANWTSIGSASNMTGVTFTATGSVEGPTTGLAVLSNDNPDVIATFNTAYAANTYPGQPNPIVVINNA